MPKTIFTTSDARATNDKIDSLYIEVRDFCEKLERIKIEVELLRKANVAMAKTIKAKKYKE